MKRSAPPPPHPSTNLYKLKWSHRMESPLSARATVIKFIWWLITTGSISPSTRLNHLGPKSRYLLGSWGISIISMSSLSAQNHVDTVDTLADDYSVPWFSDDIAQAKRAWRQYERKWRRTRLQPDLDILKEKRKAVCHLLDSSKSNYYHQKITECGQDGRSLKVMDGLLDRSQKSSLSATKNSTDSFCEYF